MYFTKEGGEKMKIEQLSTNCYRVRKTINKKTVAITFDHKPSDTEILLAFADKVNIVPVVRDCPMEVAIKEYIEMKRNVLSVTTIKGYNNYLVGMSDSFKAIMLSQITQNDVQFEINKLAKDKSAKTVRNYFGLISATLKSFRPDLRLNVTLPQKVKKEPYVPTADEVRRLLEYSKSARKGTYYVPLVLACYSLRRSEICALEPSDIRDGFAYVNKAKVLGEDGWSYKTTKTTNSTRKIPIPKDVEDIIKEKGYVYKGCPNELSDFIDDACRKLGIQHFSVHKLRHYFATRLASENVDTETIKKLGGWASDFVFQNYRHPVDEKLKEATSKLLTIIDNH